jgi:asparagine synthase (glutamine-hydrolysing)
MCGIFIVINKKLQPLNLSKCKSALNEMQRRGPDWSFYKTPKKNIFIGQVVLSMTGKIKKDLSQHYSISNNYFIVFNGEIYNYKSLHTKNLNLKIDEQVSDTKILVSLFDLKPINQISSLLDGMYAYVVYDKKKNQLIISRDPQGEKSLYIYENESYIIISSEVNPIIQFRNDNEINIDVLKTYFYTRHFSQFNKTIFKRIKNLEPGTLNTLNLSNFRFKNLGKNTMHNYIEEKEFYRNSMRSENDLVSELDFLLRKNLREMIPVNRNFASIVSGGIDSSLISNYICKISKPKKLISLNHVGKDRLAKQIKNFEKHIGKKIFQYKIDSKCYKKNLLKCLNICNSPINSHDFVGKFIISNKINKIGCRALFGGDGADELFGGYETYKQYIKDPNINNSAYTKLIEPKLFSKNKEFYSFKERIDRNWKECLKEYSFLENKDHQNRLAMMLMDSTVQLSSVGLRGCDLMSMYCSVETRSVFLRKEIVKFALNLPLKFKINLKRSDFMGTKILLKKVFLKYFPYKLIFKKQGFAGFPNEMANFLGPPENYLIKDLLKIDNFSKKIKNVDRATAWKIYNTEMYLKFFLNLNNFR